MLNISEVMDAVEGAFKTKGLGEVQMPPKSYIFFREYDGDFRVMPAYLEDINTQPEKLYPSLI